VIFRYIAAPDAQFFGSQSIQGVLKNSQDVSGAQGYEPRAVRNFNNLLDAGGAQKTCKERSGSIIGQLMDRRIFDVLQRSNISAFSRIGSMRVSQYGQTVSIG